MKSDAAPAYRAPIDGAGPVHARTAYFEQLEPDLAMVYRGLRLHPDRPQHRRWVELVREMTEAAPRLLRGRAVYRIDAIRRLEAHRLELASGAVYEGTVGQFLAHAQLIGSFVATIGSALERLSRRWLRDGQVMRGSIADALASQFAEAAAERCRQEIRAWAQAHGLDVTPPYSPGYCGLRVTQQRPLFASLPVHEINVRLNPSCLMIPIKSISGLIGLGPPGLVTPNEYPCTHCDHTNCMQRRSPFVPEPGTCSDHGGHAGGQTVGAADSEQSPPD